MICVERLGTIVPEIPGATLVEIEEEGRSTPQIVGEVEWRFRELERREELALATNEEADQVARGGLVAPEYLSPPPYN